MTPGPRAIVAATVLACAWTGCSGESAPPEPVTSPPPESMAEGAPADTHPRDTILGDFLTDYWRLPVAAQGDLPAGWAEAEASLDPQVCGACHPQQYAQWQTSLHAGAFSPGFAGQLIEGSLARPRSLRHCQTCHTPLEEQQPVLASGEAQPAFDPGLREQGIVCASCHVRAHARFGPPRRPELPEPAQLQRLPHGGATRRQEFQEARFCATCHQFFDQEGPAGKPVENTFVEWRESTHAAQGRTCQSCHMPDRAHTWRGIHDPEMVREAVAVDLSEVTIEDGAVRARLALTNHGVGHAFPSYVTPRVFLAAWQVDDADRELEGSRAEYVIGRELDYSVRPTGERFDTRVLPGEEAVLAYDQPRWSQARALRTRVTVDPGHHYRGLYQRLLGRYSDPEALALIEEALRREQDSAYVLSELRRPLPSS